MNKPHDVSPSVIRLIRSGGLKRQLLASHLTVAGIGLVILIVALGATLLLRVSSLELANKTAPGMQRFLAIQGGIHQSEAALRGWVALGELRFQTRREEAWSQLIFPSLRQLKLVESESESEYLSDLEELLFDLEEEQWYIQDVAHTPGNTPPQSLVERELDPLIENIKKSINGILEIEREQGGRKQSLKKLVEFFVLLKASEAVLHKFMASGEEVYAQEFDIHLNAARSNFLRISKSSQGHGGDQGDLLDWLTDRFQKYQFVAEQAVDLRGRQDWNVAQFLMVTRALPIVSQIENLTMILHARGQKNLDTNLAKVKFLSQLAIWLSLCLFGVMTALAIWISKRNATKLSLPILQLNEAAKELAAGNASQNLQIVREDELGELAHSFNDMLKSLKSREEELWESVARTQGILDTAADGVITIDEEGHIESFNKAARKIFGYSESDVLGENISMLMPSPYHEEHDRYLASYRETGEGKIIGIGREVVGRRKDGSTFPVDLSISEVMLGTRKVFAGIVRDVTSRKEAEGELVKAKEAALEAVRLKSEFLAMMSHEIRTPMNGVLGMTGILLESELTNDQRDCAETVKHSADALLTIINDILDFSKIESGKLDLEIIDFDLRMMVDDVLDLLGSKAHEKQLELVGLVYASVPTDVRGDPGRLRQILMNLVGNAIKFTAEGGVTIQVMSLSETDNEVQMQFEVLDTGIGISSKGCSRLFQSFSQADGSTSRKFGGTGLGLAISKQLVELMGGDIGLNSEPGQGSRFWFTVKLEKQPANSKPQISQPTSLAGLRVCVVDDNDTNRFLLHHYSDAWGMFSVDAESGFQALTVLKDMHRQGELCDLALLDYHMPDMDGMELAQKIKADPDLAGIQLILLTSVGRRGDAQKAQESGVSAYLTKPIHQYQLRECLVMVVEGGRSPDLPLITKYTVRETKKKTGGRILLADDNMVNQKVGVRMLERLGCRVDVAANGLEAIHAVDRICYDLVFMDCQMPEMDGYEATQEIRKCEANLESLATSDQRRIPIVAMTANAMKGDREKCLDSGMDDFIAKPVKQDELEGILDKWMPQLIDPITDISKEETMPLTDQNVQPSKVETHIQIESTGIEHPIDQDTLDDLRALGGEDDPAFLASVIEQYLEDAPGHMNAIRQAIDQGDAQALMKAAHSFKGSSNNMGAKPLGELCYSLEEMGRHGRVVEVESVWRQLEAEDQRAREVLQGELHKV